jgi:hypothetical protein
MCSETVTPVTLEGVTDFHVEPSSEEITRLSPVVAQLKEASASPID